MSCEFVRAVVHVDIMRTCLQVLFITGGTNLLLSGSLSLSLNQPGSFQDLFVCIFASSSSSTAFHAYELHGVHCCDCVSQQRDS